MPDPRTQPHSSVLTAWSAAGRAGLPVKKSVAVCLLAFLVVWASLWGVAALDASLPSVRPAASPLGEFSAERAEQRLRECMPTPVAHPLGSPEAQEIRDRLANALAAIGGEVNLQTTWMQTESGTLARVSNVVAHFPGTGSGKEVLAMAHYDSVAAGPGENDDLAGCVAWIEAVRALRSGIEGDPKVGIWVLLTEGEELGLLGATAFANQHHALDRIGLVVNLEARGSRGPSRLFETSLGNGALIEMYARHAEFPSATSLSVEVYRRMPNGSDLTVFLELGIPGLNFAYIGNWPAYHSQADLLGKDSLPSLQHHGENVLAVLRGVEADPSVLDKQSGQERARAGSTITRPSAPQDLIYADIHGRWMLRYSLGLQWWGALGAFGLALLALVRFVRVPKHAWAVVFAVVLWPVLVAIPALLGFGAMEALRPISGTNLVFWSRHLPAVFFTLGCLGMSAALAILILRRVPSRAMHMANLLWHASIALTISHWIPGAAIMFTPAAVLLVLVTHLVRPAAWPWASAVCGILSLFLWVPLHSALIDAFGHSQPIALLVPTAIPCTFLFGCLGGLRTGWVFSPGLLGTLALAFVMAVGAAQAPYTVQRPASLSLVVQDDRVIRKTSGFEMTEEVSGWLKTMPKGPYGTRGGEGVGAEDGVVPTGETHSLQRASLHWAVEQPEDRKRGRATLRVGPDARRVHLEFLGNALLKSLTLQGQTFPVDASQVALLGVPQEGLELDFEFSHASAGVWAIRERVDFLPPRLEEWFQARGGDWVPRHFGHQWWRKGESTEWPQGVETR